MHSALLGSLLIFFPMAVWAQHAGSVSSNWKEFSEETGGLSFRYPGGWKFGGEDTYSVPTSLTERGITPRAAAYVERGDANPYPKTTLVGAEFLYASRPTVSTETCSALIVGNGADGKLLVPQTVNGITFAHAKSADAWTCHYVREDLYSVYRGNVCYLFDLAVETECFGAVDGERQLTNAETAQIQATLNEIFSTVSIHEKDTK